MVELLKPKRGGFVRPFGCGWFIREFLMGRGPYGSPVIDRLLEVVVIKAAIVLGDYNRVGNHFQLLLFNAGVVGPVDCTLT